MLDQQFIVLYATFNQWFCTKCCLQFQAERYVWLVAEVEFSIQYMVSIKSLTTLRLRAIGPIIIFNFG